MPLCDEGACAVKLICKATTLLIQADPSLWPCEVQYCYEATPSTELSFVCYVKVLFVDQFDSYELIIWL